MAGKRQPTDLVAANGRKHMSKAEEDARRDAEVCVPPSETAKPPKWLPKALRKDFKSLGGKLLAVGLYTELDADNLGRYLIAHAQYQAATAEVQHALDVNPRNAEAAETWGKIQERYFKQARNCANDMGLTISSRCRLVLPTVAPAAFTPIEEDEFTTRLHERQSRAEAL